MKKPVRTDYPKGKVGDKQFTQAKIEYEAWVKEQEAGKKLNIPPNKLPGIDPEAGINDVQAIGWF